MVLRQTSDVLYISCRYVVSLTKRSLNPGNSNSGGQCTFSFEDASSHIVHWILTRRKNINSSGFGSDLLLGSRSAWSMFSNRDTENRLHRPVRIVAW
jgi:hypothetical protein